MTHATTAPRHHERPKKGKNDVAVNEPAQRRVYGGFNFGAAFFGWLVSTGVAVIITALLTAAGSAIAFTTIKEATPANIAHSAATVGLVSGILLVVTLAVSYFAGGYVAGRMSRFDGARQGFGMWVIGVVITLILGGIGALFGAKYNVLQQVNLPHIPISQGTFTTGGLIAFIVTIAVTLGAAIVGGKVGERYHRKVDQAGAAR